MHRGVALVLLLAVLPGCGSCVCGGRPVDTDASGFDSTTGSDAFLDTGTDTGPMTTDAMAGTDATPVDAGPPVLFACGPNGLECDAAREVCLEIIDVVTGVADEWQCAPLPAACTGDHSCTCFTIAAGWVCPPSHWWCEDVPAPYTVSCEWRKI